MGYITKDIANIDEPAIVSLARASNFVEFSSKSDVKTYIDVDVAINMAPSTTDLENRSIIRFIEPSGTSHEFHGTTDASKVGGTVFFVSVDKSDTAENLRQALTSVEWIDANFNVRIPALWSGADVQNGTIINVRGKGAGSEFRLNIVAPNNVSNSAYLITWTSNTSNDSDTIKGNAPTVEVELDVYEGADVFLGADDRPIDEAKLGVKTVSLQKTYSGQPLWFDVNGPFSQYGPYTLPSDGWNNAGTVRVFRFVAKVKGVNNYTFYQSNALFVVNGFARVSQPIDMQPYVYGGPYAAKLLTNMPKAPIVEGQYAYLNFLYADPQRGQESPTYQSMAVRYKAFSQSGKYLGKLTGQPTTGATLFVANTVRLNFNPIIAQYPAVAEVRVCVEQAGEEMTEELSFAIVSECLHEEFAVTFLNKLGGWDVFNFDASPSQNLEREMDTYTKTVTPRMQGGVENAYDVRVDDLYVIESAPVSTEVAQWLYELAASPVVIAPDGRMILITEVRNEIAASDDNLHIITFNYRYSDTYTND